MGDYYPVTDAEAAEWQRLVDQASPLPWMYWEHLDDSKEQVTGHGVAFKVDESSHRGRIYPLIVNQTCCRHPEDSRFIAAARDALPRLLSDRKRDKERILDLEDTVKSLINQYAYEQTRDGVPVLWAGHQRTLEYAYDVMGYPNPVPVETIHGKPET